jgi:hypothetical protein
MTYEEAIEMFVAGKSATECEIKKELYEFAIAALKKQKPTKPLEFADDTCDIFLVCPNCKFPLINPFKNGKPHIPNYCHFCGQRL